MRLKNSCPPVFIQYKKYSIFINMEGKVCKGCNTFKLYEQFSRHKSYLDGRTSRCKVCCKLQYDLTKQKMKSGKSPLELCIVDDDKKGAELVLTKLGYELYNKNNPVHIQFDKRFKEYEKKRS